MYILNASDCSNGICESFSFTVNAGALTSTQSGSACLFQQSGNNFIATDSNGLSNAAYITLSSTIPYTSVTVTGPGGNSGSFMALCSNQITGINNYGFNEQIQIYPSPTSNFIKVNSSLQLTNYSLQLYDVLGNVVKTQAIKNTNEAIDVSLIANGVYFAAVTNGQQVLSTQKIMVQH